MTNEQEISIPLPKSYKVGPLDPATGQPEVEYSLHSLGYSTEIDGQASMIENRKSMGIRLFLAAETKNANTLMNAFEHPETFGINVTDKTTGKVISRYDQLTETSKLVAQVFTMTNGEAHLHNAAVPVSIEPTVGARAFGVKLNLGPEPKYEVEYTPGVVTDVNPDIGAIRILRTLE